MFCTRSLLLEKGALTAVHTYEDKTQYIPLHSNWNKSPELCEVLPQAHTLMGCEITSQVGSKHAVIKADQWFIGHILLEQVVDLVVAWC